MSSTPIPVPLAPADPLIGTHVGDYVITEVIGRGGMGLVYAATHPIIARKVAVKVLKPEIASDPEQAARFLNEAQALSRVKHRAIIDVISFGNLPDGRQFMVMEFLEGEPLEDVLTRQGPMIPTRAIAIIDEVLDALSAAHRAGVVHRDLKPANVFLSEQSNGSVVVKLVDFGLARLGVAGALTSTGKASVMAGTPHYLSPEQARGKSATAQTDLYSLGVMFFEMLTGRLPFLHDNVFDLLKAHVEETPPLPSEVASIPPIFDALVSQLLAKDPAARPASTELVRRGLQRITREIQSQSTAVARAPLTAPPQRKGAPEKATGFDDVTHTTQSSLPLAAPSENRNRDTVPNRRAQLALWIPLGLGLLVAAGFAGRALSPSPPPALPRSPPVSAPPAEPVARVPPVAAQPQVEQAAQPAPVPAEPRIERPPPAPSPPRPPVRPPSRFAGLTGYEVAAIKRWCAAPNPPAELGHALEGVEQQLQRKGLVGEAAFAGGLPDRAAYPAGCEAAAIDLLGLRKKAGLPALP